MLSTSLMINSRPHLLSRLLYSAPILTIQRFFLQFKELELYWGAVFYDSKRSIGEVLFLNHFSWSEF